MASYGDDGVDLTELTLGLPAPMRARRDEQGREAGRRQRLRCEHGRDAVPEEGGRGGVRRLRRARRGAQLHVLLCIHRANGRARPVGARRGVRGWGRRLDARRRRAVGDVRAFVQEDEGDASMRGERAQFQRVTGRPLRATTQDREPQNVQASSGRNLHIAQVVKLTTTLAQF
ncbi:uncharacterized protein LOC133897782 isoform X1 [Phragmites australis]|uniref:uncharacterized protein LOC133897782 isoform X1 n=1 Tax=Phragmites australis TaxID=29695 RepID=UPI002D796982|nr:uncharacterized protein LOC133897782 isoform X1 [Phragmites australis]